MDEIKPTCSRTWHAVDNTYIVYWILLQIYLKELDLTQNRETITIQNLRSFGFL